MTPITWNEELLVGVTEIDRQHEEIFYRIDRLLSGCARTEKPGEIVLLLDFLRSYAMAHFAAEERLMSFHHYPGKAQHQGEHRHFAERLDTIEAALAAQTPGCEVLAELRRTLVDWLTHHISEADVAVAHFIRFGRTA